jgi:hypothetical protein
MNDKKYASNKNWTMLLFYRSFWNDMVSLQKTRLAKLRAVLGAMGSESRFPKLVGLSASWIKKASAGHLPMTGKAASVIHDATGVDMGWLIGDSKSNEPLEHGGQPYTFESYLRWKQAKDSSWRDGARLFNPISLRLILKVLAYVESNGGSLTAAKEDLWEFALNFRRKYGAAKTAGNYGMEMLRNLQFLAESSGDLNCVEPLEKDDPETYDLFAGPIKLVVTPTPTPQKKQPSRKSKRPS